MTRILFISALFMLCVLIVGCTVNAEQPEAQAKQLAPGDHSLTLKVGDLKRHDIVHVPPRFT